VKTEVLVEVRKMWDKIHQMSNEELQETWKNLEGYIPTEEYAPGVPKERWALAIFTEMTKRHLKTDTRDGKFEG